MEPRPGSVLGQKFALERPLARGGMGSVWAGRHLALDVPIAVKLMTEALVRSQPARARFEREAKSAAQLRSPHVVQILDYGVEDDTPYMVLELLQGEDLRTRLDRVQRLSLEETAAIVRQIAKGLALAHDAGIVHRDLKPSNVFLARIGDDEVVKLLDFGVAKETRSRLVDDSTAVGLVLGSPTYMSPEQARGASVDHRSDLWSLAVVTFHALTGHRPFASDHVGDVIAKICSDELPVATRLRPELPAGIDAFFERAFCRSPDGRFPSARVMADALATVAGMPPATVTSSAASAVASARSGPALTPREDETVSQAAVDTSRPEPVERLPGADPRGAAELPGAAVAAPPRARLWGWLAVPVAVAVAWIAWRSPLLRGPAAVPAEATPVVAPAAVTATPEAAPSPGSEATTVAPPPAASSAPTATPTASAAVGGRGARPAAPRRTPRPAGSAPAPAPSVDPKFGLPVPGSP
jgi:serine/threonine-protein kinase